MAVVGVTRFGRSESEIHYHPNRQKYDTRTHTPGGIQTDDRLVTYHQNGRSKGQGAGNQEATALKYRISSMR